MAGGIKVPIAATWNGSALRHADKQMSGFRKNLNRSLAGIGAGFAVAGAVAVKMSADAVGAAMEEEAEVAKLAKTLGNLGFAADDARVEKFIDNMQWATGVADTQLRPAMGLLVGAFKDVDQAQGMLQLSADLAAGGFGTVESAAAALAKAAGGNVGALQRLTKGGIDPATVKAKDFNGAIEQLSKLVAGQAATAADTLTGRMNKLKIGVDELQESYGKGLVKGFMDSLSDGTGNLDAAEDKLRENQATLEAWGQVVGNTMANAIGWLDDFGLGAMKVADTYEDALSLMKRADINSRDFWGEISDEEADVERAALDAADAAREQAMKNYALKGSLEGAADAADGAESATRRLITAGESAASGMDVQKAAADRLKASLDKLNDNRSIMRQRINLRKMLEEGPQGTGKDGAVTARDKRLFALDVADARAQLGEDLYSRGGKGSKAAARRQFELGRGNIRGLGFGSEFAADVLATPSALRRGSSPRPGTPQTGAQVAGVNYNVYNFTGDIKVPTVAQAAATAREAARLRALSNGTAPLGGVRAAS